MPFDDLREKDGLAFAEISFLVASGQHAQPDEQASVREKESIFTLVDIRKAPGRFEPELRDITGILHPVQAMCDWAMKELASANRKGPPYEPYMVPSLAATPWAPELRATPLPYPPGRRFRSKLTATFPLRRLVYMLSAYIA